MTWIDWDVGKKGKGTVTDLGVAFIIKVGNSDQNVAYIMLDSKQELLDIKSAYYQSIEDQFNSMLEENPMVKDYVNNAHPTWEALNDFSARTPALTEANRPKFEKLKNDYKQALHVFNRKWNNYE